ncbi:hypothetical protein [Endozoicomonas sp. ONNA1]|uniref:hypothetical protein n=1 Tax=Endozoicomonas sp. ONNA1 TaxID=2828740 RepID=UPI0021474D5B|nr:hypothetical protein [Endozoicomonas sp. ONNA1]
MKIKHGLLAAATTMLLSGCKTMGVSSTGSDNSPAPTGPTELITKTMIEVKDGAALLEKLYVDKKATLESNDFYHQYYLTYVPSFSSLDNFIVSFMDHCKELGGDYRNSICWSKDRSKINFIAEGFVTNYRSTNNEVFINVIEPKETIDMEQFVEKISTRVRDIPSIKFKGKEFTKFEKLKELESLYDDLSSQITSISGFQNLSQYEQLLASKTLHEALTNNSKKKSVWHAGGDTFGSVTVLKKYQEGDQLCADVSIYRKQGIKPSFGAMVSGKDGKSASKNTLCTETNDRVGLNWYFTS